MNVVRGASAVTGDVVRDTFVGVDIGTTNTKVALVDDRGALLRTTSFPTPDVLPTLLAAVDRAMRPLVDGLARPPRALGIASMAETGTGLDARGDPVLPLVRWDRRRRDLERGGGDPLVHGLGTDELHRATGLAPTAKAPLAMWSRLRVEHPEAWRRMQRWVGVADALVRHLTGEAVTDHTLALRTMAVRLPPAHTPTPRTWDVDLLAAVGLAPDHLARIAGPDDPAVSIDATAAARCGLATGTPVVVAGHDHVVATWAAGVRGPGRAVVSVGTSEALVRCSGPDAVDRERVLGTGMSIGRSVDGDRETLLAGAPSAGAMASWLAEVTGEDGRSLLAAPACSADGVLVAPYPDGRQTPEPDPAAVVRVLRADDPVRALAGRPRPDDVDPRSLPADVLARAVVDGLAAHLAWMDREHRALLDVPDGAGPVLLVGGAAAANRAWARARAVVLGVPVEPVVCREPVAAGAALLAAVRTGAIDPASVLDGVPGTRGAGAAHLDGASASAAALPDGRNPA
ncbi:L-fuculokinase [Curtobacterium sp. 9128]|uniref:FGGY-family carbohydrate kinase n=1 Tax=Curtobacterium sp. 9128 TaxID=1793722 RepID=UPI0016425B1B|nr:FGGY family carbohydrate kinase [Curtobacterium sp. 9128]